MKIPRIYLPYSLVVGSTITLEPNAANHIVRVLRLKRGDTLYLFNGHGGEYMASIEHISKHTINVLVANHIPRECESPLSICLVQGISRGERMDYTIQKAVELGVREIVPLFTERCSIQVEGERLRKRHTHWQAVAASACEQCGRNRVPDVLLPCTLDTWLEKTQHSDTLKLVLDPDATQGLSSLPPSISPTLLVGPEGGLTANEITASQRAGYRTVRLGPRVLRTETAALVAITALLTMWGDLR